MAVKAMKAAVSNPACGRVKGAKWALRTPRAMAAHGPSKGSLRGAILVGGLLTRLPKWWSERAENLRNFRTEAACRGARSG